MPAAKEEGRASAQSSSSISCEGKREAKANNAEKIQKRVKAAYPAPKVCQRIPPVMNSAAHQRRETTAMYIRLSRRTGDGEKEHKHQIGPRGGEGGIERRRKREGRFAADKIGGDEKPAGKRVDAEGQSGDFGVFVAQKERDERDDHQPRAYAENELPFRGFEQRACRPRQKSGDKEKKE